MCKKFCFCNLYMFHWRPGITAKNRVIRQNVDSSSTSSSTLAPVVINLQQQASREWQWYIISGGFIPRLISELFLYLLQTTQLSSSFDYTVYNRPSNDAQRYHQCRRCQRLMTSHCVSAATSAQHSAV